MPAKSVTGNQRTANRRARWLDKTKWAASTTCDAAQTVGLIGVSFPCGSPHVPSVMKTPCSCLHYTTPERGTSIELLHKPQRGRRYRYGSGAACLDDRCFFETHAPLSGCGGQFDALSIRGLYLEKIVLFRRRQRNSERCVLPELFSPVHSTDPFSERRTGTAPPFICKVSPCDRLKRRPPQYPQMRNLVRDFCRVKADAVPARHDAGSHAPETRPAGVPTLKESFRHIFSPGWQGLHAQIMLLKPAARRLCRRKKPAVITRLVLGAEVRGMALTQPRLCNNTPAGRHKSPRLPRPGALFQTGRAPPARQTRQRPRHR